MSTVCVVPVSSVAVPLPPSRAGLRRSKALHLGLRPHASWAAIERKRLRILYWLDLWSGLEWDVPTGKAAFLAARGLPGHWTFEDIADAFAPDFRLGILRVSVSG
ncbi:MAG: hypothetical protein PHW10_01830 [Candidatus Peribacteraceae bacterium]|nr:hypothetical protein [Candidatus Peribacteraceae bacterium]